MTESRSPDTPQDAAKPSPGRRLLGVLLGWAARGSSMRPRTRRAAYLLLAEANLGLNESEKAETVIEEVRNPHHEDFDTTDPLEPVKANPDNIKKLIFPENFETVN